MDDEGRGAGPWRLDGPKVRGEGGGGGGGGKERGALRIGGAVHLTSAQRLSHSVT